MKNSMNLCNQHCRNIVKLSFDNAYWMDFNKNYYSLDIDFHPIKWPSAVQRWWIIKCSRRCSWNQNKTPLDHSIPFYFILFLRCWNSPHTCRRRLSFFFSVVCLLADISNAPIWFGECFSAICAWIGATTIMEFYQEKER